MADREDLQRLGQCVVHVVDQAGEDLRQYRRAVGEGRCGVEQLLAQGVEGLAHDRALIAWRPPSRKPVHSPPSDLLRGSTTPCR